MKIKPLLCVEILEAKPNEGFTEEQGSWIRFLRYSRAIPCADCGKKRRVMWTMLCAFKSMTADSIVTVSHKSFSPLTPVCQDHPLGPDTPNSAAEVQA